jgi:DNA-binding response OmpR family regulator
MEATTRILLVEDDQLLSTFLNYKLVRNGFQVTCSSDGENALAAIEREQFDVVLLDLMLPRLNGFQLMQRARESAVEYPEVWIVISARSSDEDILRAFELGAADFLTKPFSMEVLLARVNAALRWKRPRLAEAAGDERVAVHSGDGGPAEPEPEPQPMAAKLKRWHATKI